MPNLHELEFSQLPATERLVLVTLRARMEDGRGAACVETVYRIACGLTWVERAVAAFETMACALLAGGRRPFRANELASERVSEDEQCLMAMLAAHQLGAAEAAEARASWLVRHALREPLKRGAGALALTLARSGCRLSAHWIQGDPARPRPAVHDPRRSATVARA